jgi:hypothetical protein
MPQWSLDVLAKGGSSGVARGSTEPMQVISGEPDVTVTCMKLSNERE